jgi:uncharacterized repeat protein (TIGR02543 family)
LFKVSGSKHVLEVATLILEGRARYIFNQWSDGSTGNPRMIKLTQNSELTVIYSTEVFLEILTKYSKASESCWVPIGSKISIGIDQIIVDHGNGTRHVFSGWYEDGLLFSNVPNFTFEVNNPITLTAMWTTEYQVQVMSEQGTISGEGWYPARTVATVSVVNAAVKGIFTNYVFDGWKVNGTKISTTMSYSFNVTQPTTLIAIWKTEPNLVTIGAIVVLMVMVTTIYLLSSKPKQSIPIRKEETRIEIDIKKLEEDLRKFEEYLRRLKGEKDKGNISNEVYEKLRKEYESKVDELRKKIEKTKSL